jgi:uncharacterized protein (TIGR02266 family)
MFIATETPAPLDEVVKLAFSLPGLVDPVEVTGRVVWINDGRDGSEPGMGVAFQELSPRARETINDLVRRLRAAE